jgi:hypothetical protein
MEVTILVTLLLLFSNLRLSRGSENITVQEIDGLLYVTEPVNTFQITRHVSYGPPIYREMWTNWMYKWPARPLVSYPYL